MVIQPLYVLVIYVLLREAIPISKAVPPPIRKEVTETVPMMNHPQKTIAKIHPVTKSISTIHIISKLTSVPILCGDYETDDQEFIDNFEKSSTNEFNEIGDGSCPSSIEGKKLKGGCRQDLNNVVTRTWYYEDTEGDVRSSCQLLGQEYLSPDQLN